MELRVDVWHDQAEGRPAVALDYRPGGGAGAYWDTRSGGYSLRRRDNATFWVAEEVVRDYLQMVCNAKGLPMPTSNEVAFLRNGRPLLRGRHLYAIPFRPRGQWFMSATLETSEIEDIARTLHLTFKVPMSLFADNNLLQRVMLVSPDAPNLFRLAQLLRSTIPSLQSLVVWLLDCDAMMTNEYGDTTLRLLTPVVTREFVPRTRWTDDPLVRRDICTLPCADYSGIPGVHPLEV